ncbi:Haloacid dehalogenase-like hydrolase-domain-containing protein [Podospora australis]|uniref:Haloacid dehalogenase-like hydrolase-domain-containing protein n=1 Tax=Podospora australis TaxID=1536484 RepID=A0AAN6X5D4_9PEZI|nr:Haloacid dehalogenase-like hydrolase-domain-containing protein [Podospora australis]
MWTTCRISSQLSTIQSLRSQYLKKQCRWFSAKSTFLNPRTSPSPTTHLHRTTTARQSFTSQNRYFASPFSAFSNPKMDSQVNGANPARRLVFFFDIDNCLYPKSARVHDLMADLIDKYFAEHLSLPWEDAVRLHKEYYQNYGLAIEGLVRHHQIDPLEYNAKVDDALPLDDIIKPRPELKRLLADIDKSKVKLWLFTNAYVNHAKRVVRLLEVKEYFEGVTYCDYSAPRLICKPHLESFQKAMKDAGVEKFEDCFFVDDSYQNCKKAQEIGWKVAHLVEEGVKSPRTAACAHQISHLEELRKAFPQVFKSEQALSE